MAAPAVHSTHLSRAHAFSKPYTPSITLLCNLGVQGDCHSGTTTQHTSHMTANSHAANLRQVHLVPYELFHDLLSQNVAVQPGELGENITTYGVDLLGLSTGSYLYFGQGDDVPVVQVTGSRWPGKGVERHKQGLGKMLVVGGKSRLGIMGVVVKGGDVKAGDCIRVLEPQGARVPLAPV